MFDGRPIESLSLIDAVIPDVVHSRQQAVKNRVPRHQQTNTISTQYHAAKNGDVSLNGDENGTHALSESFKPLAVCLSKKTRSCSFSNLLTPALILRVSTSGAV